ncbi:aromatic acid exporter family protein [Alkalibacterium kapii]|uniref:Putative aromatic acid exporter C-terminal domain-containing protein n=1 Tax=Alkalibacterium kapii TaxID=426704 RepID=A0A511AQE8_9LACT|nr:aromatic acid exporter family protein [Alkalibacterium kapii]GEK90430.1 hypothetical protein AKA01nite_00520 [Alkalibacterium kapii]
MNKNIKMIKMILATSIAILIARSAGLMSPYAAGIVAILSVSDTKKQSITTALQRIGATVIAFIIASIIFYFLGYSVWTFSLFLLFFVPTAFKLGLESVIASSSVLVSHFIIAENIGLNMQINEFLLVLIGVVTAISFNMWMPSYEEDLKQRINAIEEELRQFLRLFYTYLMGETVYRELKLKARKLSVLLDETKEVALLDYENRLMENSEYYMDYIDMRARQLDLLRMDIENISAIKLEKKQNDMLAELFNDLSEQLHEKNPVLAQLEHISALYRHYRNSDLPKTREEFETRATLFQILRNIERFIEIKRDFFMTHLE